VIDRAEQTGCKLTVGWTYYFDPAVRSMRELFAQDVIGDAWAGYLTSSTMAKPAC